MSIKLLTYDVYRTGMTLFKDLADQTYQDKEHLPEYFMRKVAQAEVPAGYDSAYRLIYRISGDPDEHVNGDTIGIMGSKGGGVIQSYIVGQTEFDPDWLSDVPNGPPFVPAKEFLYLILTPGNMYNSFYRYNETATKYVKVLEGIGDGAIFVREAAGKTALDSDWFNYDSGTMALTPVVPREGLLYLDLSLGKYQNCLFRYDPTTTKYIPLTSAGTGVIFAYEVSGKTPLASDWLSETQGGSPLTPDADYLYLDLTPGDYENFIFRYNATSHEYVPISGGGGGNGAIYTYVVGQTAFASDWLSDTPNGQPITPEEGPLYLILTPGQYYSSFYRYDATNHVYILVGNARTVDITKAEYLALPTAKQNDGTIYFITDSASSTPTTDDYVPSRYTVPDNPQAGYVMLWKGAVTQVFDVSPAFYRYDGTTWVHDNLGIEGQTIQVDALPSPVAGLSGAVYQYIGATGNDLVHDFFYECVEKTSAPGTYEWINVKVQPGDELQVTTLPTASADLEGKILQYVGADTDDLINGFFYQCVSDGAEPPVYSWEEKPVESEEVIEITKNDFDALPQDEKDNGKAYFIPDVDLVNLDSVNRLGYVPVGTVISIMSNHAPEGYLICDGEIYTISGYPELAEHIETEFGSVNFFGGDGVNTFAVPDLRGEFLRGTGTNSHINSKTGTLEGSGANVGVHQEATAPSSVMAFLEGSVTYIAGSQLYATTGSGDWARNIHNSDSSVRSNANTWAGPLYTNASEVEVMYTSRPTNTSILYCIAYKNIYLKDEIITFESAIARWLRFDPNNHRGVIIKAGTKIQKSNGALEIFEEDRSFDLTSFITAADNGKCFFIFLQDDGTLLASTTENELGVLIGRFHTLCADAGSALTMIAPESPNSGVQVGSSYLVKPYVQSDDPDFYAFYNKTITSVSSGTPYDVITCEHPLSGFVAGDILPESIFCNSFKPDSRFPDAMVYDKTTNICVDVYLQSGTGTNTRSEYNVTHTVSRQSINHAADFMAVGKRLLFDNEFTSCARGSNETTAIQGASDKGTVGGHVDTANRRMLSAIGCEECCGYLWQWLNDLVGWQTDSWGTRDGRGSFGLEYRDPLVMIAGDCWADGSRCGSVSRSAGSPRSEASAYFGARGCTSIISNLGTNANKTVARTESNVNYSTEEQVIGTWIDGKPIYQRTINKTLSDTNDWQDLAVLGTTCDVVSLSGLVCKTDGQKIIFGSSFAGQLNITINYPAVGTISISTALRGYVLAIVQYTKTTD